MARGHRPGGQGGPPCRRARARAPRHRGGRRRIPLWSSAIEQAKTAAAALVRGDEAPPLRFQPYFWTEQFGLGLKAVGDLPVDGEPAYLDGAPGGPSLMRWFHDDGAGTAVALNYRIPIPRLRRVSREVSQAAP